MDFDALVRAITEKVLAGLGAASFNAPAPKRRALVLDSPDPMQASALEGKIRNLLGNDFEVVFLDGPAADGEAERYILPYLCCPTMAALAGGLAPNRAVRKVLDLLLAGKKVEVLEFEYTRYSQSATHTLYGLYEAHEKTLASYGLVRFAEHNAEHGAAALIIRDSLVTEKTLRQAAQSGARELRVPPAAIVTALAEDSAKELGVKILKGM